MHPCTFLAPVLSLPARPNLRERLDTHRTDCTCTLTLSLSNPADYIPPEKPAHHFTYRVHPPPRSHLHAPPLWKPVADSVPEVGLLSLALFLALSLSFSLSLSLALFLSLPLSLSIARSLLISFCPRLSARGGPLLRCLLRHKCTGVTRN